MQSLNGDPAGGASLGGADPQPRPMRLGQVLEVGVRILRRHWAVLLGVAVLLVGPAALLTAATGARFNEVVVDIFPGISDGMFDGSATITQAELDRLGGALGTYLLASAFGGVLGAIAMLGFSAVVGADYEARHISLGAALRVCLRRTPSALMIVVVTTIIVVAIVAVSAALMIGAMSLLGTGAIERGGPGVFVALVIGVGLVVAVVYLTMRWAVALPAVVVEGVGWRDGLRRTWHLTGDNVWRTFFLALLAALLTALLAAVVTQLLAILVVDLLVPALGLDVTVAEALVIALGTVLLAPLAPVLLGVLYFDLRIRRDPPKA